MKRFGVGLIVAGMLPVALAFAHAQSNVDTGDFELEHEGQLPEEVVVSGREEQSAAELSEEYDAALTNVLNQAVAPGTSPSPQAPIPDNLAQQVLELPFPVLERDLDADSDGLSNADEERVGTDVRHPDTDGDGYIDGLEIVRAYNPLVPSPNDKVSYATSDPTVAPVSAALSVTGVRIDREDDREVLVITGAGLPHRLVTLLVFSEPRVVLVRTDDSGRFRLAVDDLLEEGDHLAYAAHTGAGGELVEVSASYSFTRTADGIVGPAASGEGAESLPESSLISRWLPIAVSAAVLVLILAAATVGFLFWRRLRRQAQEESEGPAMNIPPDL